MRAGPAQMKFGGNIHVNIAIKGLVFSSQMRQTTNYSRKRNETVNPTRRIEHWSLRKIHLDMPFLISTIAKILTYAPFILAHHLELFDRQNAPPYCSSPSAGNPCSFDECAPCCQDSNTLYVCKEGDIGQSSSWVMTPCPVQNSCVWQKDNGWCCNGTNWDEFTCLVNTACGAGQTC